MGEGLTKIDLITFEVLRNAFVAAAYEASRTIERIAYHPVIGMGRDRSNAILTPKGQLVAHGHTDAAAHYGSFEESVKELLKDIPGSKMKPGDAYLFSDPYRTGSHVNDTRLIRPIFYKEEIIAFACTVIHWPDIGGPYPGTFNPHADSCYAEGLRIPPTKLYENDELNETVWNLIALNIRGAIERRGDLTAQFEAGKLMEKRMIELADKYGPEMIHIAMEEQFDYAERLMRKEIEEMPDGEYYFEDFGDKDVLAEGQPPIKVVCKLTVKGDTLTFDWSDSDPQPKASWGGSRATLLGANYLGFMICFPNLFPLNHGVTRSINIISKPGTCVDVQEPAGTTGYCSGAFDKIEAIAIACLSQALAKIKPWRVYPAAVSLTNLCLGGVNPRTGRGFVQYTYAVGGENARTFKDGKSLIFMRFCNARTIPQELEERWFPVIYTGYEARKDSCGHGKRRGGFALVRELQVLTEVTMTIHGDREIFPPFGLGGGTNGGGSALKLNVGTPEEQNCGMYATGVKLKKGDNIYYTSSGGGGYGNPLEREPELVVEDVMDEWLSLEAAAIYYGVVINVIDEEACEYEIDWQKTKDLRAELANKPLPRGTGAHEINPLSESVKVDREPTEEEVAQHITVSRPPGW
jgi:N-methylhydantoinase B